MINAFRPYMTDAKIREFQGDLGEIDAAVAQAHGRIDSRVPERALETRSPSYVAFRDQWPGIDIDMTDMLRTMHGDLGNFAAVRALPPFPLFPWFFVIPGALVAALSAWQLGRGRPRSAATVALVILGIGLVAAPVIFQMFTRAPKGAAMIDDFRPLMTTEKVRRVQGYFLVIGAGEGALRNQLLPALTSSPHGAPVVPAVRTFSAHWPTISNTMAPMIGAMSDNLQNYDGVDALPPFWLFPWFFVAPGLLVAGFALAGRRRDREGTPAGSAA